MKFKFYLFALLLPLVACADNTKESCIDQAKKYEALAEGPESAKTAELFQRAQDKYLCALEQGNEVAGYYAAGLSAGGVAKNLGKDKEFELTHKAAKAGLIDAQLTLSLLYCGDNPLKCDRPNEAKPWLIAAAKQGDSTAYNELGAYYERGFSGESDFNRAQSCYKIAIEKGNKIALENYKRVTRLAGNSASAINCF